MLVPTGHPQDQVESELMLGLLDVQVLSSRPFNHSWPWFLYQSNGEIIFVLVSMASQSLKTSPFKDGKIYTNHRCMNYMSDPSSRQQE